jgi:hypothetical protein
LSFYFTILRVFPLFCLRKHQDSRAPRVVNVKGVQIAFFTMVVDEVCLLYQAKRINETVFSLICLLAWCNMFLSTLFSHHISWIDAHIIWPVLHMGERHLVPWWVRLVHSWLLGLLVVLCFMFYFILFIYLFILFFYFYLFIYLFIYFVIILSDQSSLCMYMYSFFIYLYYIFIYLHTYLFMY